MDTLQIQNNICQTIDIIVQNAIQNAGFDRTIQAVVSECTDESIGQYKVRYQDSTFYAYAPNPEDKYSVGAGVYILVQNNDMKKDKFIVGTVDKLGKDYLTVTDESERYEMIGANCLKDIQEIQLCSYDKPGSYKVAEKSSDKINNNDLLAYCKEADYLAIKMNVRTSLEREQRMRGNYGLKFTLLFNNKENPNQDKEETYVINIDSMIGDPYNFINPTPQFFALEFNMENFKGIKEISAFCEKFPKQKDNMPNDIFITELEVYAANQMSEEELMSPHLRFFTPRGTIFKEDLPVTAYGRIDGEDINKGEFYWFIEDNMIDSESPEFLPIGGKGWKCINFFDTIEDEEENGYIEFRPFETGYQLFELKKHLSAQTSYKCIMRYNENILSKEITLHNMSSNYSISIESSGGNKFYNDIGETTLTCKVMDKENKPVSNCIYKWISINNNDYISKLQNNTSEVKVLATSIDYFTTYQCMVYINVDGTEVLIGSSKITLTNSEETEGTYHLIINNGSQSFIYNEEGISPANKNLENPISILPLEFILYDNQGQKVPHEKIAVENVEWQIPAVNSLIQLGSNSVEMDGYYFENVYSLQFGIKSTYSVNAVNNQIALTVKYQDMVLKAFTNLIFTKEGDLGSNGTGIITRIEAIEKENSDLLQKEEPMMYYNKSDRSYSKNYSKLQVIVVEGDQKPTIYAESDNNSNCIWSILQNRIDSSLLDATHIKYTLGTGFSQLSTSESANQIANVISAKVKYNNLQFFTAFPMITAFIINNTYIPYLKKNTGFRSVKYSSDGLYPKYSNAVPFTIGIKNSQGEDVDVSSFRFKWGTNAIKMGENTFKYRPQDQYDGRAVNESLVCIIYNSSGTRIAKMFIPIYMYLNTYGYSALNDWNGNSIEIDEKGGYILTPQVGAGEKNASNQFTGLLMGKMVDSNKSEKVGLIGLYNGAQTIFLDSKTGGAYFGEAGAGQIRIIPGQDPVIEGGGYGKDNTKGLQINLSEDNPGIKFGNGNFSINSAGELRATGVDLTGKITAEEGYIGGITLHKDYGLYTNNKTSSTSANNGFLIQKNGDIYLGPYSNGHCPIELYAKGELYAINGTIGCWTMTQNQMYSTNAGVNKNSTVGMAFWAGAGGTDHSGNNADFRVEHSGKLYANNAIIKGDIKANKITALDKYYIHDIYDNEIEILTGEGQSAGHSYALTIGYGVNTLIMAPSTRFWTGFNISPGGLEFLDAENTYLYITANDPWVSINNNTSGREVGLNADSKGNIGLCEKDQLTPKWIVYNDSDLVTRVQADKHVLIQASGFALRVGQGKKANNDIVCPVNIDNETEDKDGKIYLGASWSVWHTVYSKNGVTTTSDEREKNIIGKISEKYLQFFMDLDPILYTWKDDEKQNIHFGLGAQTTEKKALKHNISNKEIAAIEHDEWDAPNSKGLMDKYSLNYLELLTLAIPIIQKHEQEINDLKQQVKQLQAKLDNI